MTAFERHQYQLALLRELMAKNNLRSLKELSLKVGTAASIFSELQRNNSSWTQKTVNKLNTAFETNEFKPLFLNAKLSIYEYINNEDKPEEDKPDLKALFDKKTLQKNTRVWYTDSTGEKKQSYITDVQHNTVLNAIFYKVFKHPHWIHESHITEYISTSEEPKITETPEQNYIFINNKKYYLNNTVYVINNEDIIKTELLGYTTHFNEFITEQGNFNKVFNSKEEIVQHFENIIKKVFSD